MPTILPSRTDGTAGFADACPPRTVFSARNGNGLCLVAGQGLTIAARCTVAKGACTAETQRRRSNNDPSRTCCCPIRATHRGTRICVWRGTGPFSKGACFRGEVVGGTSTAGCLSGFRGGASFLQRADARRDQAHIIRPT